MYKLFKKFFSEQIEKDIESRLSSTWEEAERQGYDKAKVYFNEQVEREVTRKYSISNWLVDPNRVFVVTKSGAYLGLDPLPKAKAKDLKTIAVLLKDSMLWDLLHNTLRQKAVDKSVIESTNWEQVLFGKAMIHNLGIIKALVEYIADIDVENLPNGQGDVLI